MPTQINAIYDVPRVQVRAPGKQSFVTNQYLRITPGVSEPVDFIIGNPDGKPLSLAAFTLKLLVWAQDDMDSAVLAGDGKLILSKTLQVDDPYCSTVSVIFTNEETHLIGREGGRGLRWGLFAINRSNQIFPMRVSRSGGRYGSIVLDTESGLPPTELILNG
jgi:hypothetical protein